MDIIKEKSLERITHEWTWVKHYVEWWGPILFFTFALTFLVGMASTSRDATPTSPKTARLMAKMIKLGDQMRRMSYDNEERNERMRKENDESLGRIHRSSDALSVRIENIERRREVRSSNSGHGEDEGYALKNYEWRKVSTYRNEKVDYYISKD